MSEMSHERRLLYRCIGRKSKEGKENIVEEGGGDCNKQKTIPLGNLIQS